MTLPEQGGCILAILPICVPVTFFLIWHCCLCVLMERWLKEAIWLKRKKKKVF